MLEDVACPSAEDCVVTGPEGATGGSATLLLTTDGGSAWAAVSPTPEVHYSGGTCATASECWLYGWDGGSVSTSTPVLQETTNGGASWQAVSDLPVDVTSSGGAMVCASANVCFLSVWLTGNQSAVLVTTNAAASWSAEASGLAPVTCPTPSECLAMDGGEIEVTVNDGGTWTTYAPAPITGGTVTIDDVTCASANYCWAVGSWTSTGNDTVKAVIEDTTDGGATWSVQAVPAGYASNSLSDISCPTTTCVASPPGENDLLVTVNGGQSWTDVPVSPTLSFTGGFDCPSITTCWVNAQQVGSSSAANLWELGIGSGSATATSADLPAGITGANATCTSATSCMALGTASNGDFAVMFLSAGGGSGSTSSTTSSTTPTSGGGGGLGPVPTSSTTTTTSNGTTTSTTISSPTPPTTVPHVPLPPSAPAGTYGPPVMAVIGPGGALVVGTSGGARAVR